jgi:hypothetical protein
MSRPRKVLYWIWAIIIALSLDGWLVWLYPDVMRWTPWTYKAAAPPFPFVGLEAGTKDVTIRVMPVEARRVPSSTRPWPINPSQTWEGRDAEGADLVAKHPVPAVELENVAAPERRALAGRMQQPDLPRVHRGRDAGDREEGVGEGSRA